MTYIDAGVDVKMVRTAQKTIGEIISETHKLPKAGKVISGFGHYAGIIRVGSENLAIHSDGVGTKVIVAQLMNRFDTIGIDCVAMNVNDIICVGAQPIGFIDYVALRQPNEQLLQEIAKGLVEGARQSQMAIVGGETAIVPDIIADNSENAFDLAGMALGVIKGKPVLGHAIRQGDCILGVESNGLHSNGYSLARKVLLSKYSVDDNAEHLVQTVGEELLVPTRIYVRPAMELLKRKIPVHGLAHITGGSFAKLSRLNDKVRYYLDGLPAPTSIFRQIQVDGGIDAKEMYKTFNMGIGFCVIVSKNNIDNVISVFEKYKMHCYPVGRIEKGRNVIASIGGRKEIL